MKTFLIIFCAKLISSLHICSLETLKWEIIQDLRDNGRLDCLREIPIPKGIMEDDSELNRRLEAQWDTDCSFEIYNNTFKDTFNLKVLLDVNGKEYTDNMPE